jgi:hypothetical protein
MNKRPHSDRLAEPGKARSTADQLTHGASPQIVGVAAGYPPGF